MATLFSVPPESVSSGQRQSRRSASSNRSPVAISTEIVSSLPSSNHDIASSQLPSPTSPITSSAPEMNEESGFELVDGNIKLFESNKLIVEKNYVSILSLSLSKLILMTDLLAFRLRVPIHEDSVSLSFGSHSLTKLTLLDRLLPLLPSISSSLRVSNRFEPHEQSHRRPTNWIRSHHWHLESTRKVEDRCCQTYRKPTFDCSSRSKDQRRCSRYPGYLVCRWPALDATKD